MVFVSSRIFRSLFFSGCACLILPHLALAQDSASIAALPVPIKVDGQAKDWPVASRLKLTGPNGTAGSLRLGYDATNFYALIEVKDDSPLKNSAARPEEMLKGGDAVGFYFGDPQDPGKSQRVMAAQVDGKTLIYLYRLQSAIKKPYTFVSPVGEAKFDYVAPLSEARGAFRVAKNGYNLEVAIPWKALGWEAAPSKLAFDAQIIFSDPGGTTDAAMAWWHAKGGPGDTVEDLPTEARLYPDTWGEAVLSPASATPVRPAEANPAVPDNPAPSEPAKLAPGIPIHLDLPRAGRLSLVVTDQSGWIVRELVLAEKRDKGAQTIEWDGRDRYGEALPAGKYSWKAILFDGMGTKFYGSVGNSGRPPYRTPDGLGSIGGQHGVPTAVAADEGGIYMSGGGEEGQPAMRKIDAKTGAALWKRSVGGFGAALALAAAENRACFINITGGRGERTVALLQIDPLTGKDVEKNARIVLPIKMQSDTGRPVVGGLTIAGNRAFWSETAENCVGGANLETGELLPYLSLPSPQGLVRFDAQNLLVCSGTQVLKLSLADGKTTPILSNLAAPRAVARDGAGNLYVSDLGDSQQIKKFSPDGKLLASWGIKGGKSSTQLTYDPMAFDNVTGLALGPDGNLWFNEAVPTPKRFVKMTTDGKWLEDFYGPVAYNAFGPDLDDFSTVYYNSGTNNAATQFIKTKLDYAKYVANPNDPASGWKIEAIYDLGIGKDGQTKNELVAPVASAGYGHIVAFTGANGKRYLFRLSKGNRGFQPPGAALWLWDDNRWVPAAFLSIDQARYGASWSDFNGDGLVQENERYTANPTQSYAWIGRDLTLQGFDGLLSPQKIDARGVPDYREGKFAPYLKAGEENYQDGWTFVSPQVQGATYYVANAGQDRHLAFWDRSSENRLIKVADGVVQWVVGQHDAKGGFAAFSTMSGVAGIVDDVLIVHNVEPANYIALTTDGLMLGNVLADESGQKAAVGPNILNIESFTGLYAKDPKSGKNLLFSVSSGDDRILEVTGPGQLTHFKGDVTLDAVRPRRVEAANTTEIPYQNWIGNNIRDLSIEGRDDEWPMEARGIPISDKGTVVGDVRLRRDGGNLYVLADVLDSTLLENGEGIELDLAPETGDATKIFLSATKGKPGKGAKAKPDGWTGVASISKAGANLPITGAKVAADLRWHGLGYRIEAQIPLNLLSDMTTPRNQRVRSAAANNRNGKMSAVGSAVESVPDLKGPLRLQAAIVLNQNGTLSRASWPSQAGANTPVWGTASTP